MSDALTPELMLEVLKRSGYLLESRIISMLNEMGVFVEPNASYFDKKTGVSREIDALVELHRFNQDRVGTQVCVKTSFVLEAVNNPSPVLVMTPYKWAPLTNEMDYIPYCYSPGHDENDGHPFDYQGVMPELKLPVGETLFCQYCGFSRKKQHDRDWMASHPDDLYGSIK